MKRRDPAAAALSIWTALVLLFLFFPLVVVAMFSFNGSTISRFPLQGFTFHWYAKLFADRAIIEALWNSIIVALSTVAISTTLGVLAAVGIHRYGG